jgi:hypothetical protein
MVAIEDFNLVTHFLLILSPVLPMDSPSSLLKYSYKSALAWCQENGWTDLFVEQYQYWAFPPGGVMPLPLPSQALHLIELPTVTSPQQRCLQTLSLAIALVATGMSCWFQSLMPLLVGFSACALLIAAQDA